VLHLLRPGCPFFFSFGCTFEYVFLVLFCFGLLGPACGQCGAFEPENILCQSSLSRLTSNIGTLSTRRCYTCFDLVAPFSSLFVVLVCMFFWYFLLLLLLLLFCTDVLSGSSAPPTELSRLAGATPASTWLQSVRMRRGTRSGLRTPTSSR
jgi:hypothetical protein